MHVVKSCNITSCPLWHSCIFREKCLQSSIISSVEERIPKSFWKHHTNKDIILSNVKHYGERKKSSICNIWQRQFPPKQYKIISLHYSALAHTWKFSVFFGGLLEKQHEPLVWLAGCTWGHRSSLAPINWFPYAEHSAFANDMKGILIFSRVLGGGSRGQHR